MIDVFRFAVKEIKFAPMDNKNLIAIVDSNEDGSPQIGNRWIKPV